MNTQNKAARAGVQIVPDRFQSPARLIARLIIGLGLCHLLYSGRVVASTERQNLAAQISGAHVFYQPLVWVGAVPPEAAESEALLGTVRKMETGGAERNLPALEEFMAAHPASPWLPSLQANLGRYYRERGQYTQALKDWEAAWQATAKDDSAAGKQVADFTFAYWTQLLASLGRVDALGALYQETQGRVFDGGPLQQVINGAKEGYHMMLTDPGVCFKCGTFALNNVAKVLQGPAFDGRKLDRVPSPKTGFSMAKLVELSAASGLDLVPVEWGSDRTLVVPSVIHWKENHYAAIVAQKNGVYRVVDPTFGRERWLRGEDIAAEASGEFLVPKDKMPASWKLLDRLQTDNIFGRGFVDYANDPDDGPCNGSGGNGDSGGGGGGGGTAAVTTQANTSDTTPSCGAVCSGGSGGGGDGSGSGCPTCQDSSSQGGNSGSDPGSFSDGNGGVMAEIGMPVWKVSEPYISVWLYDEPLGYQPGLGGRVSFKLAYKQREQRTIQTNIFSLGPMWDCKWLSYIEDDGYGSSALMIVPGGGERTYTPNTSTKEFYSHTTLQRTVDVSNNLTGFVVSYANGANDYYGFVPTNNTIDMKQVAFLTAKVDPFGHTNRFVYQENTNGVKLSFVVDTDGRTNTLSYTNVSFPLQITGVQDPFGRSTALKYGSTGILTNVVDVAGLSSSFKYDFQGWVTNLITPYGTTTFENVTNNTGIGGTGGEFGDPNAPQPNAFTLVRAVRIVDPVGGTNIYMLRQDSSSIYTNLTDYLAKNTNYVAFLPHTYPVSPSNAPLVFDNTDQSFFYYRDSFHWGPRQAMALPANLNVFALSDFKKARLRHWFHNGSAVSQILDAQIDPSPDGIADGQGTWYDYDGRRFENYMSTTESLPGAIGRVLPDGTTWYTWYQRDDWGRPTNVVSTYSSGFGAAPSTRSNIYIYAANNVDLVKVIGAKGETAALFKYDGNHQLIAVTNAVGDVTSYTYDTQGRLTSVHTPAGLTTTNLYYASGAYSNWVQTRINLEISRTNSYGYTNDLIYIQTNELGLVTTNLYDNLQRATSVADPRGAISYFYDKLDLVKIVDRMGFTTTFGYDAARRLTAKTNALGNYTLYDYCSCGSLDSIRDALGNFTYFYYNNAGWLTNALYPDGTSMSYGYSLLGQRTNSFDNAGHSTTNWFNNQGLTYAVSNYFGQAQFLAFDIEDRGTNAIDANGVSLTNIFDDLGRMTNRFYPDGGKESFVYSAKGMTFYTNQLGFRTAYVYDAARRKTAETNANQEVTQYTYDAAGDLLTLTDGKSQTTTWHYDLYGLVSNKVDAASTVILVYHYDADQRLTNRWSAAKTNTYYFYDPVGNLTNITYPVSPAISLSYDAMNRLTQMVDAVGTTGYGYDAVGQLLSEDGPWASDTVSYGYSARMRTNMSLQQPNADPWNQTYGYDGGRRLTSTASPAGSFAYTYDPVEHLQVGILALPNGALVTNTYDNMARMLTTKLKNSGGTNLDAYTYTNNMRNQRTSVTRTSGDYVNYAYDAIGQLTNATGKELGGSINRLQEQFGYGYDAAHNLSSRTNNALVQTFGVNSLNELTTVIRTNTLTVTGSAAPRSSSVSVTSVTVNSLSAALYGDNTFAKDGFAAADGNNTFTAVANDSLGRTSTQSVTAYLPAAPSYTYDSNGNLLNDGNRYFVYDDENELVIVYVTNAWRSDFVYDGKMRRRVTKESTWENSAWVQTNEVHYTYDGYLAIEERDINNVPNVAYTRGLDGRRSLQGTWGGIGGLLALSLMPTAKAQHGYYHSDGNGNITAIINELQRIEAVYYYDSFGSVLSAAGPLASINPYCFSSKEYNQKTGLMYYTFRYYDPSLQRWLTRDPLGIRGGVNPYTYVGNNSININDPFGLQPAEGEGEGLDGPLRGGRSTTVYYPPQNGVRGPPGGSTVVYYPNDASNPNYPLGHGELPDSEAGEEPPSWVIQLIEYACISYQQNHKPPVYGPPSPEPPITPPITGGPYTWNPPPSAPPYIGGPYNAPPPIVASQ